MVMDGHLGDRTVAGECHRFARRGGELVGCADLGAAHGRAPAPATDEGWGVEVGVDLPESGIGWQRPGERRVHGEVAEGLTHVGAIGNDVDDPVAAGSGDQADQVPGQHGLGRTTRAPQPGQQRQRDWSVEKRQRDDDRRDGESVASGQFLLSRRDLAGSVIGPARGVDLAAPATKQGVIDRDGDRRLRRAGASR